MVPDRYCSLVQAAPLVALVLTLCATASAQSLYKYRDDNGAWIYTDRSPNARDAVEVRALDLPSQPGSVRLSHEQAGNEVRVVARNDFYAPVEIGLVFNVMVGIERPNPTHPLRWVVPPRSERTLLRLPVVAGAERPRVEFDYDYMPGDPNTVHHAPGGYRAPFVVAADYPITQAYPDNVTHLSADSRHAVDIAMPIGTDVLAARGGVVFDVISGNFRGGTDRDKHLHSANIVRILHDDGTFAVYAHLNWNTIRVRPGERVRAGQYIADSGNTGFSSGPHLHFAVQRNAGMQIEALPVAFEGPSSGSVVPATGNVLTSYP